MYLLKERWCTEAAYQESKQQLGMDEYQGRLYPEMCIRDRYNTERPNQALRYLTPSEYAQKLQTVEKSAREELPSHAMQTPGFT